MRFLILPTFFFFFFFSLFAQKIQFTDQIIVKFKAGITFTPSRFNQQSLSFGIPELDAINQKNGVLNYYKVDMGRDSNNVVYAIKYKSGSDLNAIMQELNSTGLFEYTEPDFIGHSTGVPVRNEVEITPNDTYFSRQWSLYNDGIIYPCSGCINQPPPAKSGADIKMKAAWDICKGSPKVIVGFIDSGCKLDHPDLSGRIWVNTGEIPGNGIDDDGNGYVDDVNGWDFENGDNNPTDDFGHGTNTAGVVGANGNNGIGYAGVDWNCKLMITKGLNNTGSGYYSTWISCIHYLVDNGANIINASVAGTSSSATLQSAVDYAYDHGVLVVASMGNDNVSTPYYPAACSHVMAVGATNVDDTRAVPFVWGGGSNYGNWMSVCAPGNYIYALDYQSNTNFNISWSGTSESAPFTCGVAALLKAQLPSRSPDELRAIIETTADDMVGKPDEDSPGFDNYYGHGRINAYNALSALSRVNNTTGDCSDFEIFPNPAHKNFVIELTGNVSADIIITDVTGKEVMDITPTDVVTSCKCNLAAGIYFVSCRNSNNSATKKLLIY